MLGLMAVVVLLTAVLKLYDVYKKPKEAYLRAPLGEIIECDKGKMCIYCKGTGNKTILFLSGCGTPSPILDFRSLYSLLDDEYRIVVIERYGYGSSDIVDGERTSEIMLEDDRNALEKAGIKAPYILCAHSLAGLEAVSWSQLYPDEVEAVVGLDMSLPNAYDNVDTDIPKAGELLISFLAGNGYLRLPPVYSQFDALNNGSLSDEEKEQFKAVFYSVGYNKTVMRESADLKKSIELTDQHEKPDVPMLLFVSDDPEPSWHEAQHEYIAGRQDSRYIELDCGHYVHDHQYQRISEEMKEFINELAS